MCLSEEQRRLCEITASVYRMKICLHDRQGRLVFSASELKDEYLQAYMESGMYIKLLKATHSVRHPKIVSNITTDLWVGFPLTLSDNYEYFIVIGPAFFYDISERTLRETIGDAGATAQTLLVRHKDELPIISYGELVRLVMQFYYVFTGNAFTHEEFGLAAMTPARSKTECFNLKDNLDFYREPMPHATYSFEKYMLSCIREGNLAKLIRHVNAGMPGTEGKLTLGEPLRQMKNIFIVAATLTTRAAIEGGLSPELAMSLSDLFIQQMEQMNDSQKILSYQYEMIIDFTRRVEDLNLKDKYSKTVADACRFIQENVYKNIRLSDIAAHIHLSVNYLSSQFKKETGESVASFIQKTKITEAKSLLAHTDMPLLEISALLGCSSQSFFTTAFKQETGLTPKQYRQQMAL
jgi:AraC-like DNA-binding protein